MLLISNGVVWSGNGMVTSGNGVVTSDNSVFMSGNGCGCCHAIYGCVFNLGISVPNPHGG